MFSLVELGSFQHWRGVVVSTGRLRLPLALFYGLSRLLEGQDTQALAGSFAPLDVTGGNRIVVSVGLVLGLFPAFGVTTALCALAAIVLRLNMPALQAVNYLVCPLQIALFAPFAHLGAWLFHLFSSPTAVRYRALVTHTGAWNAAHDVWVSLTHAVTAWFFVCVPTGFLFYLLLAAFLRRYRTETTPV